MPVHPQTCQLNFTIPFDETKLTGLWVNWLERNHLINTFCEINSANPSPIYANQRDGGGAETRASNAGGGVLDTRGDVLDTRGGVSKTRGGETVGCVSSHLFSCRVCHLNKLALSQIRPLWRHYFANTQGLIFVVDSNDRDRSSLPLILSGLSGNVWSPQKRGWFEHKRCYPAPSVASKRPFFLLLYYSQD